jgi:leucyl-tRNA synthetase
MAKRETDTMPNWAGSSWYYLRYTDPKNAKEFASNKNLNYWVGEGVDWYNGGMEHTTLHLLYSRFWHKFLYDLKLVPTSEPYAKRTSHGLILADDGTKFSKSKGNGIDPMDLIKIYGADSIRLYEMFMGPFDQAVLWSKDGMVGPLRFLEKVWRISLKVEGHKVIKLNSEVEKLLNQTVKKVSEDIESMRFNTAISAMMIFMNEVEKKDFQLSTLHFKTFLQLLSPFAPHITEELWSILGEKKSINFSEWPKWDESMLVDSEIKIIIQVNGKMRSGMMVGVETSEEEVKKLVLSDEKVLRYMDGKEAKRVIYVKGRLINIVL